MIIIASNSFQRAVPAAVALNSLKHNNSDIIYNNRDTVFTLHEKLVPCHPCLSRTVRNDYFVFDERRTSTNQYGVKFTEKDSTVSVDNL